MLLQHELICKTRGRISTVDGCEQRLRSVSKQFANIPQQSCTRNRKCCKMFANVSIMNAAIGFRKSPRPRVLNSGKGDSEVMTSSGNRHTVVPLLHSLKRAPRSGTGHKFLPASIVNVCYAPCHEKDTSLIRTELFCRRVLPIREKLLYTVSITQCALRH